MRGNKSQAHAYEQLLSEDITSGAYVCQNLEPAQLAAPSISEVFVMTNSGLMLERFTYNQATPMDGDIFSGMFKAVQLFVEDSFGGQGKGLKELRFGNMDILITQGKYLTAVVICKGEGLRSLEPQVSRMLSDIEAMNKKALKGWCGNKDALLGIREQVDALVGWKAI